MFSAIKSMYATIMEQDVSKPEAEIEVKIAMHVLIVLFGMSIMVVFLPLIYLLGINLSGRYAILYLCICLAYMFIWKKRSMLWVDIFAVINALNATLIVSFGDFSESKFIWAIMYVSYVYTFADIRRGIIYPLGLLVLIIVTQVCGRLYFENYILIYDLKFLLRFSCIYLVLSFVLLTSICIRSIIRTKLDLYSSDSAATIIELEKVRKKLNIIGNIDHLTTLFNRRYLKSDGQDFLEHGNHKFLACMFIDVDYFKKYNDNYGHIEGDKVLKSVAHEIVGILSHRNSFTVRYGGEEILCLIKFDHEQSIEKVANEIVEGIYSIQIPHAKSKFGCITCSVGVAYKGVEESVNLEYFIDKSDEAMYIAKKNGKNQYYMTYCSCKG